MNGRCNEKRLLPDIVSVNPSNYDDFVQCERRYLNKHLLGVPASDPGSPNATGLLAHDMLRLIHDTGSCADTDHVTDVLGGHGADDDHIRQLVARHADRCPSNDADGAAHEHTFARFHKLPPPMFMATARIDAVWIHDGLLDARDYKTGGLHYHRVADVPAAKVQAFVLAPGRGAGATSASGCATSSCNPDVIDDPDPWEPDARRPRRDRGGAARRGRAHAHHRRLEGRGRGEPLLALRVPVDLPRQRGAAASPPGRCSTATADDLSPPVTSAGA